MIFIQRNPGNIILNTVDFEELLGRNDEFSWSIISKLIILQKADIIETFENIFGANISTNLFKEIFELITSIIIITDLPCQMILPSIQNAKKTILNCSYDKKEIIYEILIRKTKYYAFLFLLNDETFIALNGDIELCASIILKIKDDFPDNEKFDDYFS